MGDTNVDLLKYDKIPDVAHFIDMMASHNFQPLTVLPTRITETTTTLIDHIFYRSSTTNKNIDYDKLFNGILVTDITDHLANFLIITVLPTRITETTTTLIDHNFYRSSTPA